MTLQYLVGLEGYDGGLDEYTTREDAEMAAIELAQDENRSVLIYKLVARTASEYRVVLEEDV